MSDEAIFIDPSYEDFLDNKLFDISDKKLNRDDQLIPFWRLREFYAAKNIPIYTADKLRDDSERRALNHYWSLGLTQGYEGFLGDPGIRMRGFILMEPPLVKPKLYSELPRLTSTFEKVYLHNIVGDGYSLKGVAQDRLCNLRLPQPYGNVLEKFWGRNNRLNKLVVIAGNHNPGFYKPEFYSERIKAVAKIGKKNSIDLFGRGWDRWWSKSSCWWPYWRYHSSIMKNYKGSCESKWEILSQYRFSLCFENMPMVGYLTEKIFDCFYAGTVPIYLAAPDIEALVPKGAFINMRDFSSYDDMLDFVLEITDEEWNVMRKISREFISSHGAYLYCNSLQKIICI